MPLSFESKIRPSGEVGNITPTNELSFASKIRPVQQEGQNRFVSTVKDAFTSGVGQVKQGLTDWRNAGNNPLKMLEAGLTGAAGVVNTAFSPLAPVFKPVGDLVNMAGDKISDIKAVQKFAGTPLGALAERVANDVANFSTVAGAVGGIKGVPKVVSTVKSSLTKTAPKVPKVEVNPATASVVKELSQLDSQYAKLRKQNEYSKDGGQFVRQKVAESNVLANAIDENGVIRTKQPGGAVEMYEEATLGSGEGVVRNLLESEGRTIGLDEVQTRLTDAVMKSGLEGADLKVALNKVKKEVAGYKLRADAGGNIPLAILQDAKISMKANYLTPPDIQVYQKAVKSGLQKTIEKNSHYPIEKINQQELAPHLKVLKYLEALDGTRVLGGKLGKYFAQISGNIVGGAAGGAVGGPLGTAIGTVLGGELSGRLKSSMMQRKFGKDSKIYVKQSPRLKEMIVESKKPR